MSGWIVAIAADLGENWRIAKEWQLWGASQAPARRVAKGDDLFFWMSAQGWLAHCRATSDARSPASTAEVPWPDPELYTSMIDMEIISEPADIIRMPGAQAAALAGIPTVRLGQFPEIGPPAVAALSELFPAASPVEHAFRELMKAVGIEPPTTDKRDFASQMIAIRRGQGRFRDDLLRQYDGACCVTGTSVKATLDAAHIRRFRGVGSHVPGNGLLLRTDVHTLFDLHLLTVMPFGTVRTAPDLRGSEYEDLDERQVRKPRDPGSAPNAAALIEHNGACSWLM